MAVRILLSTVRSWHNSLALTIAFCVARSHRTLAQCAPFARKDWTKMTKKHFIALANVLRETNELECSRKTVEALADFCQAQSPRFNRERWLGYIYGANGPNGGKR